MATPACMNDDGNLAIFIGTNLESGDTVTVCPDCLVAFCTAIVEGMTGMPVTQLLASFEEQVAAGLEEQPEDNDDSHDEERTSVPESDTTTTTDEPNVATLTN